MRYRDNPAYRELLSRARERDAKAHVVCSQTRDGGWSVKLTLPQLPSTEVLVRMGSLDAAIDAVLAAMESMR